MIDKKCNIKKNVIGNNFLIKHLQVNKVLALNNLSILHAIKQAKPSLLLNNESAYCLHE